MALPAVTKVIQWGASDVFKVGGKVFAISGKTFAISGDDSVAFKVTEIAFEVLTDGGPGRQAPYFAKGQWVALPIADADPDEMANWLSTAHSLISAKLTRKLRAELGL